MDELKRIVAEQGDSPVTSALAELDFKLDQAMARDLQLQELTQEQGSLISRLLSENSELRGKVLSMGIHVSTLDSNVKSLGEVSEDLSDRLSTLSGRTERTIEQLKNYDERVTRLGAQVGAFEHDVRGNGRVQLCIDGINGLRKQVETLQNTTDDNWNSEVNDFGKMEHEVEGLFEEVRSVADRLNAYILEVRERLNGLESRKSNRPIIIKVKGG